MSLLYRDNIILTRRLSLEVGPHANPIERNFLFYTLGILQLGIQLHFVFDGPKRLSNGGKLYPGHDAPSLLLRQTFTNIGVPWHEAPAEAEAECAKMEMEKFVNGVWSEDGDALAFGCRTLIRSHFEIKSSTERAEDRRKSSRHFKVYRLEDLVTQFSRMDRKGFILNAVLNGPPSVVRELYNLGPRDVLNAAAQDLGSSLCAAGSGSEETLRLWATKDFAGYLKDSGINIGIPPEFPKWEHVQDYLNPVVSTVEVFLNLPEPQDAFLDEKALFSFLEEKFQWTIKQWVKYVTPLRVVRSLLGSKEGEESQHNCLKLECDLKQSPKKAKATFLLCKATSLDVSTLYEEKGKLETPVWILRKANLNEQHSIASYLITTPKPDQNCKDMSSASASGKPFQRLGYGAGRKPKTSKSGSASIPNDEGSSRRMESFRRPTTPPSPTPAPKKRFLPWALGASVSKNIYPAAKVDNRTSNYTNDGGKGKEKEILASSRADKKRARPPLDPNSSSKELRNKRTKPSVGKRPSTPPARIIAPADVVPNSIVIDTDEDEDGEVTNSLIVIDSYSDSDGYGSFPTADELSTLLEGSGAEVIQDNDLINSLSGDEYGSFPSSPDLLAVA